MKKIILLFSILLTCCSFININANETKIIDKSNALSSQEKDELSKLIDKYIEHTNYDMVVYFANNRNDYFEKYDDAITKLADDTFDYNDYGVGNNKDGIILCFDTYYRDYTITTHGDDCIDTYSTKALNSIYDSVTPCFKENRFYDGVEAFIRNCNNVYDNYADYHESRFSKAIKPSLIGAAIITLISFLILYSKLKSERIKQTAEQYMKNPKFNLINNGDIYLYSSVTKTKIERNNNSSDSPTHVSSSGETHGGGGSHKV